MMKKILKILYNHIVWIIAVLILIWVILSIQEPFYKWVAFFSGFIFSPFIGLLNKYLTKRSKQSFNPEILGLPFKDFITAWITFWGIVGIAGGIVQVQRQIQSQDKQARDVRFASGVRLLGNQNESARIGGAYSLYFLANEHPDEFLNPVCEILCAHIRTITGEKEYQEKYSGKPSNETQTILNLLFKKDGEKLIFDECTKNLNRTFLRGFSLMDGVISKANFNGAKVSGNFGNATLNNVRFEEATIGPANFQNATLSNIECWNATLNNVWFMNSTLNDVRFRQGATLENVRFSNAILSDVKFSNVEHIAFRDGNIRYAVSEGPQVTLSDVTFKDATFNNVLFWDAQLKDSIDFSGTAFEGLKFEDITRRGFTLEKTKE